MAITTPDPISTSVPISISILGLGRMGAAFASFLHGRGHRVTSWNRTPGREPEGVTAAPTPTVAVAASALVLLSVADDDAARAVLDTVADFTGRTVLNLTTGRPDEARALGELVASRGGSYLDGGVFGVPQTIGDASNVVIYSGTRAAHDTYGPALATLGTTRYLGEDYGTASLNDMAVLAGMYGLFTGFFQAVRMTGRPAGPFVDDLLAPWLRAIVDLLPDLAAEIDSDDAEARFSTLDVNGSGLANILRTSRDAGVGTELLDPLMRLFERGIANGKGAKGFTVVVDQLATSTSGDRA